MRRDDPSTWDDARWPQSQGSSTGAQPGLLDRSGVAQTKAMWDVRAHRNVHRAFAGVLGEEDLIASIDVLSFFRPWGLNPDWRTRGPWWHIDQPAEPDPEHDRPGSGELLRGGVTPAGAREYIQGYVALVGTSPEAGGFCVVSGGC